MASSNENKPAYSNKEIVRSCQCYYHSLKKSFTIPSRIKPIIDNVTSEKQIDEDAVNNFREYLRIPTAVPNTDYGECILFLQIQAESLGLLCKLYGTPDKPILVVSWIGDQSDLPTIWLNSHMDVVPVIQDNWSHKPSDGSIDDNGNIYGRGAQSTKSLGIQYIEAIRRLMKKGVKLKRTVHVGFVPDWEPNGTNVMLGFTSSKYFQKLNVGFALVEGTVTQTSDFIVLYGERMLWQMKVHCPGEQGHCSRLLHHPAGDKIGAVINRLNNYRAQQIEELTNKPSLSLGDVISINLTKLEGGLGTDMVPPEFIATFDMRLPVSTDIDTLQKDLRKWCKEAGEGVWIEYTVKETIIPNTNLNGTNPFWIAIKKATDKMKLDLKPVVSSGKSDAYLIRKLGIPAIGFSPINNTVEKVYYSDEYINVKVFLKGIYIYSKIISAIANVN